MTLASHEVMGDNRLASDDGCEEGEDVSWSPVVHLLLPTAVFVCL